MPAPEPLLVRWARNAGRRLPADWLPALAAPPDGEAPVPVALTLAHTPAPLPPEHPVVTAARRDVAQVVTEYLTALGLPGKPTVDVTTAPVGDHPYRLLINGRPARCAGDELAGIVASAGGGAGELSAVPADRLPDVAAALCRAAVLSRPSILLGPAHLDDLGRRLAPSGSVELTKAALRLVVDTGVSLADRDLAAAVLADAVDALHPAELAEALIEALRPPVVSVLMEPGTLRRVTTVQPPDPGLFPQLRTRLYADHGVLGPGIRLISDDAVPAGHVAIRLNAITIAPRRLGAEEPLTDVHDALDTVLRRHASWLVSVTAVKELLEPLSWVLPDTVKAVERRYSHRWLAAVARSLVAEGVSLRHTATLLDWLLDLDDRPVPPDVVRLREGPVPAAAVRPPTLIPSPSDTVSLIRQRWLEEHCRMTGREAPLPVHRLSDGLERELEPVAGAGELTDEQCERAAVEARGRYAADPGAPLLVRSPALRAQLREALRAEFPDLRILAVAEVPPALRVVSVTEAAPPGAAPPQRRVGGVW
jgi:hypothetical protein